MENCEQKRKIMQNKKEVRVRRTTLSIRNSKATSTQMIRTYNKNERWKNDKAYMVNQNSNKKRKGTTTTNMGQDHQ